MSLTTQPNLSQFFQLLDDLKSLEFAAHVNYAASAPQAIRLISAHPAAIAITAYCRQNRFLVNVLLQQIRSLSHSSSDPKYAFPWDAALAALLVVVRGLEPTASLFAATMVRRVPNLWWGRKTAEWIISNRETESTETVDRPSHSMIGISERWARDPVMDQKSNTLTVSVDSRPLLEILGVPDSWQIVVAENVQRSSHVDASIRSRPSVIVGTAYGSRPYAVMSGIDVSSGSSPRFQPYVLTETHR